MASVTNPELVLAIKMFQAENTPESRAALVRAMRSARFLVPCKMDNIVSEHSREPDGSVLLEPHTKVYYLVLTLGDGRRALPIFTDMDTLHAANPEPSQVMVLTLPQVAALLDNPGVRAEAVALNFKTANLILPKTSIRQMAQPPVPPVDPKKPVQIGNPQKTPPHLLETLQAACAAEPCVHKAWLRMMRQEKAGNWLVVLETAEGTEAKPLFDRIAKQAAPHTAGISMTFALAAGQLGQAGIQKALPFYIQGSTAE